MEAPCGTEKKKKLLDSNRCWYLSVGTASSAGIKFSQKELSLGMSNRPA
jgi:hypothetical protein